MELNELDDEFNTTPPEVEELATAALNDLLPDKSKPRYEMVY